MMFFNRPAACLSIPLLVLLVGFPKLSLAQVSSPQIQSDFAQHQPGRKPVYMIQLGAPKTPTNSELNSHQPLPSIPTKRQWRLKTEAPLGYQNPTSTAPDYWSDLGTSKPNYLNDMQLNGQLIRWSTQHPIRVYVETNPTGLRHFEPSFPPLVMKALQAWNAVLGDRLEFKPVQTLETAHIAVRWTNQLDTQGIRTQQGTAYMGGVTVPHLEQEQLKQMEVTLPTLSLDLNPKSADSLYPVILHEMGHALGLLGHTNIPNSLMQSVPKPTQVELSPYDRQSIRQLYGQPVDITSLPPTTKNKGQKPTSIASLKANIQKSEAEVKLLPSNLNWNNLGSQYFQLAQALATQEDSTCITWYQQAIGAMTQAVKAEPTNPNGYFNRALTYRHLAEWQPHHKQPEFLNKALQDLNQAVQLDRKNTAYYLERSALLLDLGQPKTAQENLETYLKLTETTGIPRHQKAAVDQLQQVLTNAP